MKIKKFEGKLKGVINIPGDKSISHRSIMFGSLAKGETNIYNYLLGEDCKSTISCFKKLGVNIKVEDDKVTVDGVGLYGLKKPEEMLYVGNSGTTIRLMSGILAGQSFETLISGDKSIQKRPMDRVIAPLKMMGADIDSMNDIYPPIRIKPVKNLKSIKYHQKLASAQVKSCILLAGMYSQKPVKIVQPEISRDHTERMMQYFGIPLIVQGNEILMETSKYMIGKEIFVPGDISTAAFYMTAALLFEGSEVVLKNVGINPTRTGILEIYKKMGADITLENYQIRNNEPSADIIVKYSKLKGIKIQGEIIPKLIDEIPIIAAAAAFAEGTTIIKNAAELKVKETNRINAVVTEMKKMGIDIQELEDGMIINGSNKLKSALINSYDDHRIAMTMSILAMKADGESEIANSQCVNISNPDFYDTIKSLCY